MGHSAERDAVARLIDQHAPHGFAGFMRARNDGCLVYVTAVALLDAFDRDECLTPPAEPGADQ